MARIEMDKVSKTYSGGTAVVEDISIDVRDGEFLVLVGPSGSGKSTLLRMVAGLEEITGGEIRVDDRVVNGVPARSRDLAMVFQNYALYPHMTVAENMAFALKLRKVPKEEQRRRVAEVADLLALGPYLDRKPAALSGGQRQRVAMGRAIVREPKAFLMDEPLSNLDAKLRVSMRNVLSSLHERLGVTTIYVTHDQIEAMTLGERVAVLADGRLQQVDTPQRLYDAPANLFVAGFIGSPAMNMVDAQLVRGDTLALTFGSHRIAVSDADVAKVERLEDFIGRDVIVGVRPPTFRLAEPGGAGPTIDAKVNGVEELGSEINVIFEIDAPPVDPELVHGRYAAHQDDEEQSLTVEAGHSLWTARLTPDADVHTGEMVSLSIDTSRLHYFDPSTGLALTRLT